MSSVSRSIVSGTWFVERRICITGSCTSVWSLGRDIKPNVLVMIDVRFLEAARYDDPFESASCFLIMRFGSSSTTCCIFRRSCCMLFWHIVLHARTCTNRIGDLMNNSRDVK